MSFAVITFIMQYNLSPFLLRFSEINPAVTYMMLTLECLLLYIEHGVVVCQVYFSFHGC